MIQLSIDNQVAPLLYRNLKQLNAVPEKTKSKLEKQYRSVSKANMVGMAEVIKIIRLLKKKEVDCIPLKGMLASDIIFRDIGVYMSTDIDLLVKKNDIPAAKEALIQGNYQFDKKSARDMELSHYHYIFIGTLFPVELHWNLVKRYFIVNSDYWWNDVWTLHHEGTDITMLSHERNILYLVFRLFDHGFRPLKFIVLLLAYIEKYSLEIDWNKLLDHARECRMERLLSFALILMNDLWGMEIPHIYNGSFKGYESLRSLVISGLFEGVKRPHARMVAYLQLLDSKRDVIRVLLRRIFPEPSEIRLRYGIGENSKKVYLYYILNPLLLVSRKIR
jgi:hypothetical protein